MASLPDGRADGRLLARCRRLRPSRPVEAGFWFEPVTFQSKVIGGAVTAADLAAIEGVGARRADGAFRGLPIVISARRDATFRVRVVQEVRDRRMRGNWGVAGESFSVPGLGGHSSVSFLFLASGAVAFAPAAATRDELSTRLAAASAGPPRTSSRTCCCRRRRSTTAPTSAATSSTRRRAASSTTARCTGPWRGRCSRRACAVRDRGAGLAPLRAPRRRTRGRAARWSSPS